MRNRIVPAVALLLTACAAQQPHEGLSYQSEPLSYAPGASAALAAAPAGSTIAPKASAVTGPVTEVVVSPNDEAYGAVVCETRNRPGSNIKQKFCTTREALNAQQQATKDQLSALEHEQRWRDQVIRQAEMSGRRPSGFGLGPN